MNPQPFDTAQGKNPEEKLATPKTEKLPYEAPQATFVPLKLEERLLACDFSFAVCPTHEFS